MFFLSDHETLINSIEAIGASFACLNSNQNL